MIRHGLIYDLSLVCVWSVMGLSFFLSILQNPHREDYVQVECVLKPRCKKCMEKGMNKR